MHAESSDGFASVGTILPKEEAALLPGGFFALPSQFPLPQTPQKDDLSLAAGDARINPQPSLADG
jgi:hypothetical protein